LYSNFFKNEVTTFTPTGPTRVYENDIIVITVRDSHTNTQSTADVRYRVKYSNRSYFDVTPIVNEAPRIVFPTRLELNNLAAQRGARAEKTKHSRIPKKALVARTSYQGMARLPCYRSTRPR
jgi:hypothetical protein